MTEFFTTALDFLRTKPWYHSENFDLRLYLQNQINNSLNKNRLQMELDKLTDEELEIYMKGKR